MGGTARKVLLPVMTKDGAMENTSIDWLRSIYERLTFSPEIGDTDKSWLDRQGDIIDYKKVLLQMVSRCKNPQAGMDFKEQQEIHRVVTAIEKADMGGVVYLSEEEFAHVCEKVKAPYATTYNALFFNFIEDIINSSSVPMVEKKESQNA